MLYLLSFSQTHRTILFSDLRRRHISINPGDTILHPQYGVGCIKSIRRRSFVGEEPRQFAKLFFKRDKLTVMMHIQDVADSVRSIISARRAQSVLKYLQTCDEPMSSAWKTRASENEVAIKDGEPNDLARVYKGLATMQNEGMSLRAADRKHLQASFDSLTEELAAALDKPQGEIQALIRKRCGLPALDH